MKNEHLNRFLKESFRSLGVNLNVKTATRVNNSADTGLEMEKSVNDFFDIDYAGKSHVNKDRTPNIKAVSDMIRREKAFIFKPKRAFNGPEVSSNVSDMFDEAKYRSWHFKKEKELLKFEKLRDMFFTVK